MPPKPGPSAPVRITVPHAPGGMPDILGRILAEHLSGVFHQQFYVENRAGGNGVVGAAVVRATPPDGHNLIVTGFPLLVIQPLANPNVGFDPLRDFTHIAYFGGAPLSGPRGMPDGLTQRLNREVIAALHRPDVRDRLDRDAVLTR